MFWPIKKTRWFYISLSVISLCLAFTIAPIQASPPVNQPVVYASASNSGLDRGRNLFQQGKFSEALAAWQMAAQQYARQSDRLNQALSLSYVSLAQQELGQWDAANKSIEQSLQLLQNSPSKPDAIIWAQILNTQANLQLSTGQAETAIATWQQAQKYYEQADDITGSLGSQINQAQALQRLGFYRRSRQVLSKLTQKMAAMPDSEVKVSGLRSLGLALHGIGDENSQQVLEQSLALAQKIQAQTQLSSVLSTLGKVAADGQDPETAFNYFEDAEKAATNPNEALEARLARFKLLVDFDKVEHAIPLVPDLKQKLEELTPSHDSLYATINFVATLNKADKLNPIVANQDLAKLMAATVKSARQLQDAPAEAHALYQWGKLYSQRQQWDEAMQLAEKSLNIARQIQANDIVAQSAWELGQLYKQKGNKTQAVAAYSEAVEALQSLRSDLVAVNPNVQFSFRESVEPVYRELVALLLEQQPNQQELLQARDLVESLQMAELDNFFREACIDKVQQIDRVDPKAAVIYPIILRDRLAIIISQTGEPLRYYTVNKSQTEIEQTLDQFLAALNPVSDRGDRIASTQQIYNWLIRPAEADGAFKNAQTLVFVLDGKLRNIPMAALFDGEKYLIEKYAVALSPGLKLMAAQSLQQGKINAIVAGISESRSGFAALPAVESEVKEITKTVSSDLLLNQKFTNQALGERLKYSNADVVHLATHGQFSSRLEDTYLLTWDGTVNVKELSELLKQRGSSQAIELLVLSACDTATGDDRAVLGLAGLAVKSGARSTVATLWPVKDKAAAMLMTEFYQQLQQPNITKAEALRQAQIELIRKSDFPDPFFWSAFVLVGNWL